MRRSFNIVNYYHSAVKNGNSFSLPQLLFGSGQTFVQAFSTTKSSNNEMLATLVLLRHGQSTWNANPTFTGWCDAPLTERGISEAEASGKLLRDRGFVTFDVAYTSMLQRAVRTCELALDNANSSGTPVERAWQLNERHYGALQGFRKDDPDIEAKYGIENLESWRRDFSTAPPPMDENHKHFQPSPAPLTESLEDCQDRVLAYWHETILPSLTPNSNVLLAAHSNTLRALVSYLDQVPSENVPHIHIPNSVPCVYKIIPSNGKVVSPLLDTVAGGSRGQWIFSSENHKRLRKKIGGTGSFIRSIFEAWDTNGDRELDRQEIETGLKKIVGTDNIAISALAGKILEEIDKDTSQTIDLNEFQTFALEACQKLIPELLEEGTDK